MLYFAHTGNALDKSDWQLLPDHLRTVAELAAQMAAPLGLEKAAFLAGLFHDLGKYAPAFQRRLEGAEIRVDHSTAGARLLLGELVSGRDKGIADLIAYCIAGHHAGLPDRHSSLPSCLNLRLKKDTEPLDEAWRMDLRVETTDLVPSFVSGISTDRETAAFQYSMMTRAIFSCLVDADYKDTEAFYARLDERQPDRRWPTLQDLLPRLLTAFDTHMAGKANSDTELNRLRGRILSHVRGKATDRPGLFTLTVPTGGGKTLASLGFALDHAKAHGHTRIIYAIPFTSIIDQTAAIFRDILGNENVLEHHWAIEDDKLDREEDWKSRDKLRLAMEDWAAPVVVTTNVQFFESLFAARTSRARKVHNIFNSVIILDEAQIIPRHLLLPCLRALDELALNYRCTIILCTATQPALDQRRLPGGLPLEGRELAPDPQRLSDTLRRTRIIQTGPMSNDDLVAALREEEQTLVIVNSRKHTLELYHQARSAGLAGLVHLTTRQYAADRQRILGDVRERLNAGKPCRVIATSLIEAGVDVDFPKAWRAEAGLDQIIQAAGRVNREGRRPVDDSVVTVFSAPDYPPPSEIRGLIGDMERMRRKGHDLQSLGAIDDYFGEVYWRAGRQGLDRKGILADFKFSGEGTDFSFRTVAEKFRMIESEMVPVIVLGDEVAREAVEKLQVEGIASGGIARKLQTYVVQVPPKARDLLIRNGHVAFVRPDLRGDQFAVLQTESLYDREVGLLWEDAQYLATENSIV
ncbi:CRISPR-associated helicase Cas3' [Pseudorhizobium endolithicum]|nr:CRISPR-associated helicase Cas3' [Pseudorhizobium endolithicum]